MRTGGVAVAVLAAAWSLPPATSCADARTAIEAPWYQVDERPLAELDRAAVLGALGDLPAALALARSLAITAREAEDLPLQAEALHRQAVLERAAGDAAAAERSLLTALWAAEASHQDELVIDSETLLLEVLGDLGRDEEAIALWQRLTMVLQRRSDDGRRESAALHARLTQTLEMNGDLSNATAAATQSVAMIEALLAADPTNDHYRQGAGAGLGIFETPHEFETGGGLRNTSRAPPKPPTAPPAARGLST